MKPSASTAIFLAGVGIAVGSLISLYVQVVSLEPDAKRMRAVCESERRSLMTMRGAMGTSSSSAAREYVERVPWRCVDFPTDTWRLCSDDDCRARELADAADRVR